MGGGSRAGREQTAGKRSGGEAARHECRLVADGAFEEASKVKQTRVKEARCLTGTGSLAHGPEETLTRVTLTSNTLSRTDVNHQAALVFCLPARVYAHFRT